MQRRKDARLSAELHYYKAQKDGWLPAHAGEFVVITGQTVLGFFPDWEEAYRAGVRQVGPEKDFLLKQVLPREPVHVIY